MQSYEFIHYKSKIKSKGTEHWEKLAFVWLKGIHVRKKNVF